VSPVEHGSMDNAAMKRQLVISSDDLGMTCSVNRGIESAMRQRLLTSTNFMVPCPWFEHAAQRFRDAPIDLGIHLTLTCEWDHYRWRPLSRGTTLVDRRGYLYPTIAELMAHASEEDIRNECRQQIAFALDMGLPIVYADLHMCLPALAPDESGGPVRLWSADYELTLMRIVDAVAREFGLAYPYALAGERLVHFASHLSITGEERSVVERYLRALEPGVHHLSCHVAVPSDEQDSLADPASEVLHAWALPYRVADLECIGASWFRELLDGCGIELVGMPFVARAQPRGEVAWK
jgi:hypothetical protein